MSVLVREFTLRADGELVAIVFLVLVHLEVRDFNQVVQLVQTLQRVSSGFDTENGVAHEHLRQMHFRDDSFDNQIVYKVRVVSHRTEEESSELLVMRDTSLLQKDLNQNVIRYQGREVEDGAPDVAAKRFLELLVLVEVVLAH